jgi:hypothetical protein
MVGASSSAAASLLSTVLPGSGLEAGTNVAFEEPAGELAAREQTAPERACAALYAFVVDRETNNRSCPPAEFDLETVKALHTATQSVHRLLKSDHYLALKAAGLTYFDAAFGFVLVDHLGYASRLVTLRINFVHCSVSKMLFVTLSGPTACKQSKTRWSDHVFGHWAKT